MNPSLAMTLLNVLLVSNGSAKESYSMYNKVGLLASVTEGGPISSSNDNVPNMSCTQLYDEELFEDDSIQTLDYSSYIDKVNLNEAKALSDTLDQYKIIVTESEREATLTNNSFKQGGVNKKVHRETGTLRADTKVGVEDFARETDLAEYVEDKPELAFYTSFQRIIDTPEGLDTSYTYAEFDIYDKNSVTSTELLDDINFLDRDDALDVALQMIEIAKIMYNVN
ncbi:hypothetical protein [Vibrio pectenicida]|uniref:Uncharacterized protein n=1 Tax=Vibrio pectenicida TaxID=62763 RepID=A0A3R9FLL9_9VIBR|nr:hypothetical protein [Vibrio pectenicida]RSD30873.1 hypothetical protein EJA03_11565 [Vibrio pectenicida]